MAVSFSVPSSPKRSTLEISNFMGVDLTNTGSNISETRSPNAPNMIRDVPGKVRKRMGYATRHIFKEGSIYGAHVLKNKNSEAIYRKNLCKTKVDIEKELNTNDEFYFFSDECIPVGSRVHIQFIYETDGEVEFSPYIADYEWKRLDALNHATQYSANFEIKETTNAFVFKNVSTTKTTITLSDIMIYFVEKDEAYNASYSSYSDISELRFYMIDSEYTTSDYSGTVSDTTGVISPINLAEEVGTALVQAHLDISNFSSGTVKNIEVFFECKRYEKGSTTQEVVILYPVKIFTSLSASGYEISCIVDPTENHTKYDETTAFISGIQVKVEGTVVPFTADVKLSNQKIKLAMLKKNLDENDYIRLVHVGNCMYQEINGVYSLLSEDMNTDFSRSWQNENKLYIIDGQNYHVYNRDDQTFVNISQTLPVSADNINNVAYVPTLTIAKSPSGGGVSYEDLNLLTPAFMEWFGVTATDKTATNFQLSFGDLDSTEVKAWVMDANGSFVAKTQGTDFTVNRATGTVTFTTAPGESPVQGEDNVKILAYKTNKGYAERINNCTVGTLFGVNGAADRIFLSGNPNFINYDWHSEQYQYNYFPDTGYAKLGSDSSAIMGYSIVNNYLAAHKDEDDLSQSVIIREGDLVVSGETSTGDSTIYDQEPAFKIINTLQGAGAICKNSFATLQTEPVFLTRSGIFAITPQDMTGEKYSQNRSFYINEQLLAESSLENAYGIVYNDMYLLFVNTKVYVLDGLQATRTDKSEPYSSRQYAAFVLNNIPASIAWIEDDRLWFGTTDGRICQFHNDKTALESYNDDGKPISAWWETADLDGALFYKKKTFRYIAVRVKANIMTHVTIYAQQRGIWTLVKKSKDLSSKVFAFSTVVFSNFTFNNDTSDPVVSSKLRVKKVDKARFKLENSELNEPFGLENLALEFVESGNYKG